MIAIAVAIVAATAAAVDVRGSVTIPPGFGTQPPSTASRQFYWEEWNGFLDPRPARFAPHRELAVVMLGQSATAPAAEVRIAGGNLSPATIVVRTASELRIVNTDACAHELYAEGIEGFGPLQTAPGNARAIRLPAAGRFVIRDRQYAHVEAHLHVLPNVAAIGNVARDGSYTFPGLAAGTYTLKAFHREHEVGSQQVEVPDQREFAIDPVALRIPPAGAPAAAPAAPAPAAPAAPGAPAAPAAP